jgi:hypothetical protein
MQGKRLMEFLAQLSGYNMTARWKAISTRPEEEKEILRLWYVKPTRKTKIKLPDAILFILTQRYAGQKADVIIVSLKRFSYDSKMERNNHKTRRREGDHPAVACGNRR